MTDPCKVCAIRVSFLIFSFGFYKDFRGFASAYGTPFFERHQ